MKNPLAFLFSSDTADGTKVSNREIFRYAEGSTGQAISGGFTTGRVTYFYQNHIVPGKNSEYVGFIMTASIIWDAINDILVGTWIDRRAHKPFEKMKPYLTKLPPFIALLGAVMFLGNILRGDIARLFFLAGSYFCWDLLFSFEEVGIWGKLALSSENPAERAKVTQWVTIGGGLGGYIPKIFPFLWDLLKAFLPERTIFIIFAFIFSIGGQLLVLRASSFRERIDSPVHKNESFLKSLTVLRHNPTLLLIGLAKFARELYPRINRTYFYQSAFCDNEHFGGGTAETIYDTVSSIPGACSVFFANRLIDKFGGMKRSLVISQIAIIAARIISYFVGITPALPYNSAPGFIVVSSIIGISSAFTSFMDIAHRSLINDSVDEVELKTGLRTEGISASALSLASKINTSATSFISNITLYKFLGYKSLEGDPDYIRHQSPKFYKWQYPIFILAPVIGEALYILVVLFIKDDEKHKAEVQRQLHERREAAKRAAMNVPEAEEATE